MADKDLDYRERMHEWLNKGGTQTGMQAVMDLLELAKRHEKTSDTVGDMAITMLALLVAVGSPEDVPDLTQLLEQHFVKEHEEGRELYELLVGGKLFKRGRLPSPISAKDIEDGFRHLIMRVKDVPDKLHKSSDDLEDTLYAVRGRMSDTHAFDVAIARVTDKMRAVVSLTGGGAHIVEMIGDARDDNRLDLVGVFSSMMLAYALSQSYGEIEIGMQEEISAALQEFANHQMPDEADEPDAMTMGFISGEMADDMLERAKKEPKTKQTPKTQKTNKFKRGFKKEW